MMAKDKMKAALGVSFFLVLYFIIYVLEGRHIESDAKRFLYDLCPNLEKINRSIQIDEIDEPFFYQKDTLGWDSRITEITVPSEEGNLFYYINLGPNSGIVAKPNRAHKYCGYNGSEESDMFVDVNGNIIFPWQ